MIGQYLSNKNESATVLFFQKKLFSLPPKPKAFQDSPSHQILRHMYRALNIIKIKTNYTVYL